MKFLETSRSCAFCGEHISVASKWELKRAGWQHISDFEIQILGGDEDEDLNLMTLSDFESVCSSEDTDNSSIISTGSADIETVQQLFEKHGIYSDLKKYTV
jgi:hypothetical protein